MSTDDVVHEGLEGVRFTRTSLSHVDGERGRLVVAGHDVETLAGRVPFEGMVGLLADGHLPDATREAEIRHALGVARVAAFERLPAARAALDAADPMDALRGVMALQPPFTTAAEAAGAVAVAVAAWAAVRAGVPPRAPSPGADHAADLLRMATGLTDAPRARALDAYLVTVADHGMNASTFAARVVASTGSDLVSAVVAGIGALKGPLHGGAPGPVLDMLDAIGAPDRAVAWLEGELAARRRIMGMGHRVYRVRDPRAAVLERVVMELEQVGVKNPRLELARAVEAAATGVLGARYPARALAANVEFYTAILLDAIGLPRALFTPTFAAGRVAGWAAHVFEQRRSGRLIRPDALYVGAFPAG